VMLCSMPTACTMPSRLLLPSSADALVQLVASIFATRVLGKPHDLIGTEFARDRAAGTIWICQELKALALADAFCVGGERKSLHMSLGRYDAQRAACDSDNMVDKEAYQSGIGTWRSACVPT
jgi:hypothetical protein